MIKTVIRLRQLDDLLNEEPMEETTAEKLISGFETEDGERELVELFAA